MRGFFIGLIYAYVHVCMLNLFHLGYFGFLDLFITLKKIQNALICTLRKSYILCQYNINKIVSTYDFVTRLQN